MQELGEKMRHFPILDLFYRSLGPARDPEPMIETLVEIALSAKLAAATKKYQHIRASADDFLHTILQIVAVMANQHLEGQGAN